MRVPLSWLRDYTPVDLPLDELEDVLSDLGLVVDGIEKIGEGLEDVVIARIDEISAIEGADRIRLTKVDAGHGAIEVVCGAKNFALGDLVPLAPVGATLPGGFEIAQRKMKGVTSNGMLCSGRELGIDDNHDGLMILTENPGALPGMKLVDLLGISPDVVFDISVEGNRPDGWSIAGVARDLAARLSLPYTPPKIDPPKPSNVKAENVIGAAVHDRELCPRLVCAGAEGVAVTQSPQWLQRRLTLAGMRPINNIVDVSNYVMLEMGQPTHAYDLDRLGGGAIAVRRAQPGETVVTLDGVTRTLGVAGKGLGDKGVDCVIVDGNDDVVGVAGVMGGTASAVSASTTRILLEVAAFEPLTISATAKRLNLRSEASARFERGVDISQLETVAQRFFTLLGVAPFTGVAVAGAPVPQPIKISVPFRAIERLLGVTLDGETIAALLSPIGFSVATASDHVVVTVPLARVDIRPAPFGVADVIEEIARLYGYSSIERRTPTWAEPGGLNASQILRRQLQDVAVGLGCDEAWTPTLVDDAWHQSIGLGGEAVRVANPLVAEEAFLRRSLLPGLLQSAVKNLNRRRSTVRLFEVGTIFSHPSEMEREVTRAGASGEAVVKLPAEHEHLGILFANDGDDARCAVAAWRVIEDALRLDSAQIVANDALPGLHPTRSATIVSAGVVLGVVGEIDPDVARLAGWSGGRVGWLDLDIGAVSAASRRNENAREVSRFPSSDIDLAFVLSDEVPAAALAAALGAAGGDLLEALHLFDVHRGGSISEGSRSLAYRLRFVAMDRTLTDEEVGQARARCIDAAAAVGATLR